MQESKAGSVAPQVPPHLRKNFHRRFETSRGPLTADQFPPIDWAVKSELELLFPAYQREQLALLACGGQLNKSVDVGLNLKSPDNSIDLFVNASLTIERGKRCAVYGINGSGKTCMFEAISAGAIRGFPKHLHVHHMKELEHDEAADEVSVLKTVMHSHPFSRVLVCMEEHLLGLIAAEEDEERKAALQGNLSYVQLSLKRSGYDSAEARATGMLRVLGFDETGFAAPMSSLSGGLRMRVSLTCAFFINPDVLLLDEPTNHLDLPSVLWLENRLRSYKGAYLLVTHDRQLLENVVTSVMMIQDCNLIHFNCGFKDFEKRRETMDVQRAKEVDDFLRKNRNLTPFQAEYKRKQMYQEWVTARRERQNMLAGKFTFKSAADLPAEEGQEQKDVSLIKIENVRFSYNEAAGLPFIFDTPISYEVKLGTRVGIMGPNGAGKSTLLKLITGKIQPTNGTVTTNPDLSVAYFGQHSTKELKLELTPVEFMQEQFPEANRGDLKEHLAKTSIGPSLAGGSIRSLSFSQRSCVIFAKLTFVPPHLLILDEPTNFLDLDSVDSLIRAVNMFKGGLITVTHNRDFLKRCSKHFLSIIPGAFLEFDTMSMAERATYSFISALEEGRAIDTQNVIRQNAGGGAAHTADSLAATKKRLNKQQRAAKKKAAAEAAERKAAEDAAAAKAAKKAAKKAAIKLDWVAGEKAFVFVKANGGSFVEVSVVRNVRSVGVTVAMPDGSSKMFDAKKLKQTVTDADIAAARGGGGGKKRGGGGGSRGKRGGRGGSRGGRGRGGSRGGARGRGRGGSRGRGSRGRGRGRR